MKKITLICLCLVLANCAHMEKKAPCDFNEFKKDSKNKSVKEDYTRE